MPEVHRGADTESTVPMGIAQFNQRHDCNLLHIDGLSAVCYYPAKFGLSLIRRSAELPTSSPYPARGREINSIVWGVT